MEKKNEFLKENMERTILHCDCNGFFASVECVMRPELKTVPMAVCGDPQSRHGIILAKNELAKKYKIQTAETIWQAKRKCPELVLVRPHHEEYQKYSTLVNQIYRRYTDLVEPFGIDESWLDVTGSENLFGTGRQIADEIRGTVRDELGLTVSVGVSFNKIFAKLGSDYKKPDATTVISRENYKQIVFPLPASDLLFVGKSAKETLNKLYIHTIGDLAGSDEKLLCKKLGKMGHMLYVYANGEDDSPVKSIYDTREVKSVGNGMTYRRDLLGMNDIQPAVHALCDSVASRLRRYGLKCRTLQVTIRNPGFKTTARQKALSNPTYLSKELYDSALSIIRSFWNMNAPIRMITVTGINLVEADEAAEQLSLFRSDEMSENRRQENLETAIDGIRCKFGQDSISFADILHSDLGIQEHHED